MKIGIFWPSFVGSQSSNWFWIRVVQYDKNCKISGILNLELFLKVQYFPIFFANIFELIIWNFQNSKPLIYMFVEVYPLNWNYHTVTKKWKCLFFTGHLTTHPCSWLISWRYLVMNRLAVLCGHDDCLARSNVWCGRNLRYQISHALRQVLWLQTRGKLTQEAIVTYLVKTVLTI